MLFPRSFPKFRWSPRRHWPWLAAPPVLPAPKPISPPFPYQYFGRMLGLDGKLATYLLRGDALIAIHEQEVSGNTYRIDSLSESQ